MKGFTLIELVVAVSIMLLGIGVVSKYNTFNDNERLRQAADTVISNLRLTQSYAIAGKLLTGCNSYVGYVVTFNASKTSYTTAAECLSTITVQTYTLPNGIQFNAVPASIRFSSLAGSINTNQTIKLVGFNTKECITVSQTGAMERIPKSACPVI